LPSGNIPPSTTLQTIIAPLKPSHPISYFLS
jgi:hypothetical protein